jgi:hypothetical protein
MRSIFLRAVLTELLKKRNFISEIYSFSDSEEFACLEDYYIENGNVSSDCKIVFKRSAQRLQYTIEYRLNKSFREI